MENQTKIPKKESFCNITEDFIEAILAESGILTIMVLCYECTKNLIELKSPKLYRKLTPLRRYLIRNR